MEDKTLSSLAKRLEIKDEMNETVCSSSETPSTSPLSQADFDGQKAAWSDVRQTCHQRLCSMDERTENRTTEMKPLFPGGSPRAAMLTSESTDELMSRSEKILLEEIPERRNASAPSVMEPESEALNRLLATSKKAKSGPAFRLRRLDETPHKLRTRRNESLLSISTMHSESACSIPPITAMTMVATSDRNNQRGQSHKFGSLTSPKLLCDMGPAVLSPTRFPSPRDGRFMVEEKNISTSKYLSKPKSIVQEDLCRIRQCYPLSCVDEEEEEGQASPTGCHIY